MPCTASCTCGCQKDATRFKNTNSRDKTTATTFDPVFVPALISTAIGIGLLEYERNRKKHGDNHDYAWEQFKHNILNPHTWDPFNMKAAARETPRTNQHSQFTNNTTNINAYSMNPHGRGFSRPQSHTRTHSYARANRVPIPGSWPQNPVQDRARNECDFNPQPP